MAHPRLNGGFALLCLVLSSGCAGDGDLDARHARIETLPSGMVKVTNDGVGEWTPADAWTLEEDLRLGSLDQEGPELFSRIASVQTDAEGRIFILDSQTQEIRVFTASGAFSHKFGGRGDGPGELSSGAGLSWDPEGRLWVWATSGRYTVFDPTGEELARHSRLVRNIVSPWSGGFTGDGRYLDWGGARETSRGESGQTLSSGRTTYQPIAFTPPSRFDTLPELEYGHPVTANSELVGPPGGGALKSFTLHVSHDGIWFAHPDEYTIYKRTFEGDTLLAFSMPARPMAFPTATIDSVIGALAQRGTIRTREHYYSHRRLMMRILTDGAGHVYVFPQEEGQPQGHVADVFRDSGVYLGRVTFPDPVVVDAPPPHITRDHIYAVLQHELGVHYLVRLRIVRP